LLISIADVLGLLLLGPFLFAIGIAFGPLMIAGLVTPWTRDYFKKWVQFLVLSAALQAVLTVIISIATTVIGEVKNQMMKSDQPTAVSLFILTILVMLVSSLISQAPAVASAMFPGHIGADSGGGDAANKAAKHVAKAAGPLAKKGIGKGWDMAKNSTAANLTKTALSKIYGKKS
jgi:type IV secretory pathway VirB6-like protein